VCHDYAPCLTDGATNYVNDAFPDAISELCHPDQVITLEGRSGCRTACSHAKRTHLFVTCMPCVMFLENNLNAISSAEEIKAKCTSSNKSSYTHMPLCEVECERGACCFLPQGCGDIFPENDCTIYEPCAFMYDGQTGTAPPSEQKIYLFDGRVCLHRSRFMRRNYSKILLNPITGFQYFIV
jgi:hypothetical protein